MANILARPNVPLIKSNFPLAFTVSPSPRNPSLVSANVSGHPFELISDFNSAHKVRELMGTCVALGTPGGLRPWCECSCGLAPDSWF